MSAKSPFGMFNVPPHGVRVLAARPYTPEQPAYLGGSLHLSQGIEIKDWLCQNEAITFSLALGHQVGGDIFLYLPKAPLGAWISGQSEIPQDQGGGIYSLYLQEAEGKEIKIRF
jgi:alpha-galactosidase